MATALYSQPPLADFILSEAPGQLSRENVVVTQAGTAVKSGTVLKAGTAGKHVPYDGTGNPTGILYNQLAAATSDTPAVAFTLNCEVKGSALTGLDAAAVTKLLALGIKVRTDADVGKIHTPAL